LVTGVKGFTFFSAYVKKVYILKKAVLAPPPTPPKTRHQPKGKMEKT